MPSACCCPHTRWRNEQVSERARGDEGGARAGCAALSGPTLSLSVLAHSFPHPAARTSSTTRVWQRQRSRARSLDRGCPHLAAAPQAAGRGRGGAAAGAAGGRDSSSSSWGRRATQVAERERRHVKRATHTHPHPSTMRGLAQWFIYGEVDWDWYRETLGEWGPTLAGALFGAGEGGLGVGLGEWRGGGLPTCTGEHGTGGCDWSVPGHPSPPPLTQNRLVVLGGRAGCEQGWGG